METNNTVQDKNKISRAFLKFHYYLVIDNALYTNAVIIVTDAL